MLKQLYIKWRTIKVITFYKKEKIAGGQVLCNVDSCLQNK